jgi:hypothetical protein
MTFDVTTNRIPFGLLTSEEQATLKAWPHGFEVCSGATSWMSHSSLTPNWSTNLVYRGKPAPKVTSYWFNLYDGDRIGQIYTVQYAAASELKRVWRLDNSVTMRMDICNGEVAVTKET